MIAAREEFSEAAEEEIPPCGWEVPGSDPASNSPPFALPDLEGLIGILKLLKEPLPQDILNLLLGALHQLLVAIRAVFDWYLEKLSETLQQPQPAA